MKLTGIVATTNLCVDGRRFTAECVEGMARDLPICHVGATGCAITEPHAHGWYPKKDGGAAYVEKLPLTSLPLPDFTPPTVPGTGKPGDVEGKTPPVEGQGEQGEA